jgi:phospholipid N-methyltransferase
LSTTAHRHAHPPRPFSPAPRRGDLRTRATFLKEFIKAPGSVAAVAPSSPRLAAAMLHGLDVRTARTIVEYGPGTGAFTRALLDRLGRDWFADALIEPGTRTRRIIAVEFNAPLADMLRRQHPEVTVVNDSAANVSSICQAHGVRPGEVDCIISGLGWPGFTDEFRSQTLQATADILRKGGEFRTFGYHVGLLMRGAWHFRREVRRLFTEVHVGRVVWGNMPPAFVYRCVK